MNFKNQSKINLAVNALILVAWLFLTAGYKGSSPFFAIPLSAALILFFANYYYHRELVSEGWNFAKIFKILFPLISISWLSLIFVEYYSIEYNGFDTGIYANQITNLIQEGRLFCTIYNKHPWANHFTPNLFLLTPLFYLQDTFLWLPVIKLLCFLCCPFILYYISREILGAESRYNWLLPLLWIFNRYLVNTLRFEFQVSSLSLPFILLAFYFALREKRVQLFITMLFLLGFKEHLALIWVSAGIFLLLYKREFKSGGFYILSGIVLGLVIYTLLMPSFGESSELSHSHRFGPFAEPGLKIKLILSGLISVGLLPVFAPKTLLFLLPAFGLAFVSADKLMLSYNFHYQDLPLTVLFFASAFGLKKLLSADTWLHKILPLKYCPLILPLIFFTILFYNNQFPARNIRVEWPQESEMSLLKDLSQFKDKLSPGQEILSNDSLVPYFSDKPYLQTITRPQFPAINENTLLVISDRVNPWPLTEAEVSGIINEANNRVKGGSLKSVFQSERVSVFARP